MHSITETSCGVIPYRYHNGQREYLILLQNNHFWSFPKGHMEPGETQEQTALRELFEETGLQASLIPGKKAEVAYDLPSVNRKKQVVLYLGKTKGTVRLQESEVCKYKWVSAGELKAYLQPDTYAACKALL